MSMVHWELDTVTYLRGTSRLSRQKSIIFLQSIYSLNSTDSFNHNQRIAHQLRKVKDKNIIILFFLNISIFQYVFCICTKYQKKDCEVLYRNSRQLIMHQRLEFKRKLYSKINWNARFIGIKGPKGVGKSTMLLQYIKENLKIEHIHEWEDLIL